MTTSVTVTEWLDGPLELNTWANGRRTWLVAKGYFGMLMEMCTKVNLVKIDQMVEGCILRKMETNMKGNGSMTSKKVME